MGEEEGDHTMEEVEEEQEVEDFSNSKDTALAGFLNINGYVKSILKVDDMMRKAATLTPGLPVSWGIDKGYPGLFFVAVFARIPSICFCSGRIFSSWWLWYD